ncbi:MAG: proline--tRNA ligase [Flavobacteriaceae bacterium]|jgi:prolyl-tRNA synthetase|nr:proline--tRNA ligase [Flavobacteriaceae bacterium]|tara:strand:- start:13293 stop:14552 length:1260 start_codon:yes stop_codon:yes gene_type:complete
MKASLYHYKTLRESPSEAELTSHKLMIRANMIKPLASGIYSWLPLGNKVLKKVEKIIREEMDSNGCLEVLMPMVQPKDLWEETGRSEEYGPELLGFKDRSDRNFYLGPTHEEVITDIARKDITSPKDLPIIFYQIQTKFRDEIRPRFGVMRAREFLMKDAYSFDLDESSMKENYEKMKSAYIKIFNRLDLDYRIVKADSGSIGGNTSEEFHVLANSGEDLLAFSNESDFACNVELIDEEDVNKIPGMPSPDGKGTLSVKRGIEVGHIFQLGDKYSKSLNLKVQSNNSMSFLQMGCYGIGVSRIVAASIEQNHDDNGIIFPKELAPFDITLILINKMKSNSVNQKAEFLYENLSELGSEILLDDRDCSPGIKFSDADLIGCPYQIVISEKALEKNCYELVNRSDLSKKELTEEELFAFFS